MLVFTAIYPSPVHAQEFAQVLPRTSIMGAIPILGARKTQKYPMYGVFQLHMSGVLFARQRSQFSNCECGDKSRYTSDDVVYTCLHYYAKD